MSERCLESMYLRLGTVDHEYTSCKDNGKSRSADKSPDFEINVEVVFINPIDPKGLPSNMRYFPRISQNSLKIPLKFRANTQIQILTNAYLLIKTKQFLLHLTWNFMGFNLIYWTTICGKTFLDCSILEKCGNGRFSGWLRPDWGHTARAATAGLGSKVLICTLILFTNWAQDTSVIFLNDIP